jgi:hypothetical protein
MEQVISWSKQIESKHALFVFDSCFSGSVLQSRAVTVPEDISYLTAKPVRQFISAGSANQAVPAVSVFRPLFIRGINGKADLDKDGYVTGDELGSYLQKQVPYYETGQIPQYGKIRDPYLDEGNFVFEVGNRRRSPTTKIEPIKKPTEKSQATKIEPVKKSRIGTIYISYEDTKNLQWSNPASWKKTRKSDSDSVYIGEVFNGLPNGQGTLIRDKIGSKYIGTFKNGLPNGQGNSTWSKGEYADDQYFGEWKDYWRTGQGTYIWAGGEKYVGEWKNDMQHGQGTYTWPDGGKYVGEFKDGKEDGQGTYTSPDGGKYVGEFKDGKRNGQGTYTWPSGGKYVGEYKDGKRNGQGTYTSPDGRVWSGPWRDDEFLGSK